MTCADDHREAAAAPSAASASSDGLPSEALRSLPDSVLRLLRAQHETNELLSRLLHGLVMLTDQMATVIRQHAELIEALAEQEEEPEDSLPYLSGRPLG